MKLIHPDSKTPIEVAEGSEGPYLQGGWTVVEPKVKKPAGKSDDD